MIFHQTYRKKKEKIKKKPLDKCSVKLTKSAVATMQDKLSILAASPKKLKSYKKTHSKKPKTSYQEETVDESKQFTDMKQKNQLSKLQLSVSSSKLRPLDVLNRQVVYSFVPYTVGNHQDVTKSGCARELIECKACLRWPAKSVVGSNMSMTALGRGGAGPGVYTVMIVDHPKKQST